MPALIRARGVWDTMRTEVTAGQYLDLLRAAGGLPGPEGALKVARYKSAGYTVQRPLQLGAALAGAGPARPRGLHRIGLPLGEAFQLRDDVLGVFGDPAVTGKSADDDLREGKQTLLVALAEQRGGRRRPAAAARGARQPSAPAPTQFDALRRLIESHRRARPRGAADRRAHRPRATRRSPRRPSPADARDALDALAVAATMRTA